MKKKESAVLCFLYNTFLGRCCLKLLTKPGLSKIAGKYMDTRFSCIHIKGMIRRCGICLSDYEKKRYESFNDFFTRKIKAEKRPVDYNMQSLIAPCDGKLSAYHIDDSSVFSIKRSHYNVEELMHGSEYYDKYKDGICLVFRLCVDNYHRFHYIDDGNIVDYGKIPGILHTVRPIAVEKYPVFVQNSREYTVIRTEGFGDVAQIEVGAIMIGRIENYKKTGSVKRAQEKGKFLYGGSTVVVLLEKEKALVDEKYFEATVKGIELPVKMGQRIGQVF